MIYIKLDARFVTPPLTLLYSGVLHPYNMRSITSIRYWGIPSEDRICFMAQLKIVMLKRFSCATTIHKDMNIPYYAYMDSNLAW